MLRRLFVCACLVSMIFMLATPARAQENAISEAAAAVSLPEAGQVTLVATIHGPNPAALTAPLKTISATPWWSQEDTELIARLIYSEARGESYKGQLLIAQCVLDRLESGRWGDSVRSVVYAPGQFAKPGKLTKEYLAIATEALNGKEALPGKDVLFFQVSKSKKDWYAPYLCHIGNHAVYGNPVIGKLNTDRDLLTDVQ